MTDSIAARLETLSDTVFGVAVTFMAYRLPGPDRFEPAPSWAMVEAAYAPHLLALVLSFSVAIIFWLSHHRRLAIVARPGRVTLLLNFAFLLLVILLPITSDLFGTYGRSGDAVGLYAGHLALISSLNFALWVVAAAQSDRPVESWRLVAGPGVVAVVFVAATIVAQWRGGTAEYLMFSAFAGPLVSMPGVGTGYRRRLGPPLDRLLARASGRRRAGAGSRAHEQQG